MAEHTQQKSWFSRNWPWAVPLGGCLTLIIIFCVFLGSVIFGFSKAFTNSTPYQDGFIKAQEDEYVVQMLGEPIETNGIMNGSLLFENNEGSVDISIPIKGPEGEATIYVVGTKQNDIWTYSELYVIIDKTNEQVDLLWGEGQKNE
ncbi:cytochrome c oxidase assembly factor Coa1 family protein [uncultured Aquimarina sp.]|uniref:cytochrome c oxidase assembly factor Coa1 family protein n=1 Tax=uncultured Aquimarina sp. TaxID=575652 RepID=UPI0026107FF8|nr:cytochrome c oxidase assembly factor Coa1 family protein [uncultured Aquimarina sp.]